MWRKSSFAEPQTGGCHRLDPCQQFSTLIKLCINIRSNKWITSCVGAIKIFVSLCKQCKQKMTAVGSASRCLSRSLKSAPQCLLRSSETSSSSSARNCSTSTHRHPPSVSWHSTDHQLRSSKGLRPGYGPVLRSFWGEPFAKTRRRFSTSTMALHNELVPPKPGEEYVIKFFMRISTNALQTPYHFHR